MRILQILSELRRNPTQNVKAEGHAAAVMFLKSKGRDVRNYGVSMTTLPKLGINPGSKYNTPVGIYFYPADYYVRKKEKNRELEFQDGAPYIQVFELKGNIENIDGLNQSTYTAYLKRLYENAGKISTFINKSEKETTDLISQCVLDARTEAKTDSYGGHLWYILYALSFQAGKAKRENAPPRSSVVWNSILRLLGIDGLIDEGEGIIHENEPYQGVVLDPRSVRHVNTFTNVAEADDLTSVYQNLADKPVNYNYVSEVIESIVMFNLKYNNKYATECKTIMNKVMQSLEANPTVYSRLDWDRVSLLLTFTPKIRQKLTVDYYAQRFPKLQAELIAMITMWDEYRAQPNWAEKSDMIKRRAYELSAPRHKVNQATEMLNNLTPYRTDPKAMPMIKFINDFMARLQ